MKKSTVAVLSAAAFVTACGGDYRSAPPVTSEVPSSATKTIDGFTAYLQELVVASADMLEPVDTEGLTFPVDETSEPSKVD